MTKTLILQDPMYTIIVGNEFYAIDSSSGYPYKSPWLSTAKNFGSVESVASEANRDHKNLFKNEVLTPVKVTGIVYETIDVEVEAAYQKELDALNKKYGRKG